MLTRQTLRRLATEASYSRGESLWAEGAVRKLARPAPTRFSARVRGSHSYSTELWLAQGEAEFSCDCPYAFEGICKHAVALGLAVLDTYGPDLSASSAAPEAANLLPTALAAAWAAREAADKLHFLELALAKNPDLARQFLAFGATLASAAAPAPADLLTDLAERIGDTLGGLSFDEDFWASNQGTHDYDAYDEGDGLHTAALEEISQELQPFVDELLQLARAGQLALALRYWDTASLALSQLEEPECDDFGLFSEYGLEVAERWATDLQAQGWPQVLLAAVLPPAEVKTALKWLGKHLAQPPGRWGSDEASWLPVLLALAHDPTLAPLLPAALGKAQLSAAAFAYLALQTARTLPNDDAWVQAAEILAPTDASVAEQLLHFYTNQGNRPALLRAATAAFAAWPDRFSAPVLQTFTAAQAPDLYRDALRYRALANHSLDDFARLRPLLTPAQVADFVAVATTRARSTRHGIRFAADLLAQEAPTADLLAFGLDLEWYALSPGTEAEQLLVRLAAADPTALMLELEVRMPAYVVGRAGAKRGHDLYERLARWLSAVRHAAPRLEEPILRLARHLREEFPTLYGLRDALRQVGLLPGEGLGGGKGKGSRR